ncbi:beta-galactosidase GalB [Olivibacter ginsenosidimutans]|uniref:Beta-galactosidase GalB n=1 Tax=Olivibacter ginsenosidimutans TaxID=1176537 RepID=A0ABP9CF68_9SPHI
MMKQLIGILLGLLLSISVSAQPDKILFNDQWLFHLGDLAHASNPTFDDQDWQSVRLPHDWSVAGPFSAQWASATGYLPGGIGWYRKTFELPKGSTNDHWTIYFDGVYKNAEVWINGHYLGKRPNGFVSFYYDLSPYLLANGKNVLAVKVDHSQFADSRWYTGSGIYRNVYLIHYKPVHIATWGVAFATPNINKQHAESAVDVKVMNQSAHNTPIAVTVALQDATGNLVAQQQVQEQLLANDAKQISTKLVVHQPQQWSVDQPYLYTLSVSVSINGQLSDSYEEKVGFRSIRFDARDGFFLNERNMKLKGVCIHDDAGALGVATNEQLWRHRLQTLKAAGVNAIRMSHNPHADFFYTLCDELGLLVMDEAFDEWEFGKNKWMAGWNVGKPGKDGYHEYFKEWAERDVQDMILRNRNRPSIILWSIGNEVDYPNDPYSHEVLSEGRNPQIYGKGYLPDHPAASRLSELSAKLVSAAKAIDTTRPITAALAGVVMSNTTDYPSNIDVVGYNYQEYRYPEDHQRYPNRIIYGSENGMQYQAWLAVDTNAYISGQFLWTGIDYLGEAGKFPSRSNGAGLIDLAGFPKSEYYFRQSLWAEQPMVYIGSSTIPDREDNGIWSHKRAEPIWSKQYGDQQRVTAFTNADEVELWLNGKSYGRKVRKSNKQGFLWWDIPYQDGTVLAKAYRSGKAVAQDTLQTVGPAERLVAKELVPARENQVRAIWVQAVDAAGNPVLDAHNSITVHIDGQVQFRGMENGNHQNTTPYLSKTNQLYGGKTVIYIEKLAKNAAITVQINSDTLKGTTFSF